MNTFTKLTRLAVAATVAAGCTAASAAEYSLAQAGFTGGGALAGSFSGTDADNNGLLMLSELSAFQLHFAGDTLAPDLDLLLGDLDGFVYRLAGGGPLGDDAVEGISTSSGVFLSGFGVVGAAASFVDGGNTFSESTGAISVQLRNGGGGGPTTLQSPAPWALLVLAGFVVLLRLHAAVRAHAQRSSPGAPA